MAGLVLDPKQFNKLSSPHLEPTRSTIPDEAICIIAVTEEQAKREKERISTILHDMMGK
jgi:hypothetical protein